MDSTHRPTHSVATAMGATMPSVLQLLQQWGLGILHVNQQQQDSDPETSVKSECDGGQTVSETGVMQQRLVFSNCTLAFICCYETLRVPSAVHVCSLLSC